jgi:hypothetical protein
MTLNDHAMGMWQAIEEVRCVYNTIIQVCLYWRKWDCIATSVTTKSSESNPEN